MRIRPQSELANVQNRTLALNQAEAVTQNRFDAALLQAAQSVRDSEQNAFAGLSPRMRQALSAAMEQLGEKTPEQLEALAKQPQALASFGSGIEQSEGLNSSEAAQLGKLLMAALPRLLALKSGAEAPENSADAHAGASSGAKQGSAPLPTDFFSIMAGQVAAAVQQPGQAGTPGPSGDAQNSSGAMDSVGPSLLSANEGLAGAQAGQAYASVSGVPFVAPGAGLEGGFGASALSVSVNAGFSPAATQDQGLGSAGQLAPAVSGGAGQGSGQQQVQGGTSSGPVPQNAPANANVPQNDASGETFPLLLDLDVQVTDSTTPLAVQTDSQVTLKGDGTWVFPQGAQVQGTKAPLPAASGQSGQQTASAPTTASQQPNTATEPSLPLGPAPQTAVGTPNPLAEEGQDVRAGGIGGGESEFLEALALQEGAQQGDGETTATGVGTQVQTAAANQTAGQQSGLGLSQTQASQQLLGQLPVLTQTLQNNAGQSGESGASGQGGAQGLAGPTTQNGQAQGAEAFGAALASLNQNSPQASSGFPTPAGNALTAGIAQAVTNALNDAGGANPGRLVIQLSPANLGDVQVDLSMVGGKLTARLVTSQQDVRDALVRDLSGFKASLESHGVIVNEVSVAVRAGVDNGQQQADQQTSQNLWRSLPLNTSRESASLGVPAGLTAYGDQAAGGQLGFSALA